MMCRAPAVLALCLVAASASAQEADDVERRIAELSAPDPVTRAFAACHLAEMRRDPVTAIEPLTRLLADATPLNPVWCTRRRATMVLASWRSSPGLEAARALSRSGAPGIEALLTASSSSDPAVRGHAIRGLAMATRFLPRPPRLTRLR